MGFFVKIICKAVSITRRRTNEVGQICARSYSGDTFRVKSYESMIKMLRERPSVDAGVFSEPAYHYWMKRLGFSPDDFGEVIFVQSRDDWTFDRKDLPENIKNRLKRAIQSLKQEGYYDKLLRQLRKKAGF